MHRLLLGYEKYILEWEMKKNYHFEIISPHFDLVKWKRNRMLFSIAPKM